MKSGAQEFGQGALKQERKEKSMGICNGILFSLQNNFANKSKKSKN